MINKELNDIVENLVGVKVVELSTWKNVRFSVGGKIVGRLAYEIHNIEYQIKEFNNLEISILYLEKLISRGYIVQDNLPSSAPDITKEFKNGIRSILGNLKIQSSNKNKELLGKNYNDSFQVYIEDFNEFLKVNDIELPKSCEEMKDIKETVFKECLQKIIGGSVQKDWGGETSDYYTTHIHLKNQRLSGAFLLKGPASFRPMGLNHLGKNNDQIVRLSKEPVDILFVQHSHDILPPVKETLKVFATQPSNPRKYCLIDGRDSLRILKAYDLLDWAKEKSKKNLPKE